MQYTISALYSFLNRDGNDVYDIICNTLNRFHLENKIKSAKITKIRRKQKSSMDS